MNKTIDDISNQVLKTEVVRLEAELRAAIATIDRLMKDNFSKADQITHLESMLVKTVPVLQTSNPIQSKPSILTETTAEEEIAVVQLQRLRESARVRSLTLEETRIYDLLVKNKKISQVKTDPVDNARDVSVDKLLEIAGQVEDESTKS